tara:strand:- start:22705 stop:23409 length:705 start_codon:yes stop_codon:yes gene_type:complete
MIKNTFVLAFSFLILAGCSKKTGVEMYLSGEVYGLKKGTLYLEKIKDGRYSKLDSFAVQDNGKFELNSTEESGEMHFLSLDRQEDKTISFFGENSHITINTNLEKFVLQAKISGSKNDEKWRSYINMTSKFQNQNLEIIKANFEAQRDKDERKMDSLSKKSAQWLKRKYLYTTNFAISNSDSEVAPYLALTALTDANIQLLDTIQKSLSDRVKISAYGKELNAFLKTIRENEQD